MSTIRQLRPVMAMSAGFGVDVAVLFGGALLLIGVVATGLTSNCRAPSLLLFLGLGMVVADDGLGLIHSGDAALAQNIAAVASIGVDGDPLRAWSDN